MSSASCCRCAMSYSRSFRRPFWVPSSIHRQITGLATAGYAWANMVAGTVKVAIMDRLVGGPFNKQNRCSAPLQLHWSGSWMPPKIMFIIVAGTCTSRQWKNQLPWNWTNWCSACRLGRAAEAQSGGCGGAGAAFHCRAAVDNPRRCKQASRSCGSGPLQPGPGTALPPQHRWPRSESVLWCVWHQACTTWPLADCHAHLSCHCGQQPPWYSNILPQCRPWWLCVNAACQLSTPLGAGTFWL